MKKLLITASAICLLASAKAQFTYDYLKAADEYYRKADYYSAATYYEKYLNTNGVIKNGEFEPYSVKATAGAKGGAKSLSGKEQAIYNLAESYRQLNYYVKAEPFYQQAAAFDEAKFPLADYHYATTLRALGKFEEAERAFRQFLAGYTANDAYTEAANREILNLEFIQMQMKKKDLGQYTINPSDAFASEGANYAPVWASANTVYFTSTRPETGSTKFVNTVYQATHEGATYANVAKVAINQPGGEMHQGGVSVSADGNTMYLTRWTVGEGKKIAGSIYRSTKSGDKWSDPKTVGGLSVAGVTDKEPFVMPDGKLLFSSDRAGGQGGYDVYMVDVDAAGNASNVTNLTVINTKFNEEAPYYHEASKTLVFATDGRVGMGGFDLFYSAMKDGAWATPENFGYPVNSIKNEKFFASRGGAKNILQDVLLSSDRAAECCLQMFALSKIKKPKLLAGTVVDCKTNDVLAGVQVEVKDAANNTVFTGTTSGSGAYNFSMEDFAALQISGKLKGYTDNGTSMAMPVDDMQEGAPLPVLCLNKIPEVGTVEVLDNVYFEYNKAVVLDESHASLDKLVRMLNDNPTVSVEIGGHTDAVGNDKYNQKLSEARAKSVVEYLASQGIDKSRLKAKGYGEAMPVAPNTAGDGSDNPEGRAKNRRTEFKVIKN